MSDRALEAATDLIAEAFANEGLLPNRAADRKLARAVVVLYLNSLLGDIPKEAVAAACRANDQRPESVEWRTTETVIVRDVFKSLRNSLDT